MFLFLLSFLASANPLEKMKQLKNLSGTSLQEEKDFYVFITASSYCPCYNSHIDHLNALNSQYEDFQFIGLHTDPLNKADKIKAYYQETDFNFPVLKDESLAFSRHLEAMTTPHVFVFSKSDNDFIYSGAVTDSATFSEDNNLFLSRALSDISRGKAPFRSQTRPHGCIINYAL